MRLQVYVDRMSQPSRAILIFCKVNGIDFEEIKVDLSNRQHRNPEFEVAFVLNTTLGPALGRKLNPQAAVEDEKLLSASLEKIESIWLKGNGRFLLGSSQPSIADLSLVCELMQLEVVDEKSRNQILGPHKKVQRWIEDTKRATQPHFEEVHGILFKVKAKLQNQVLLGANTVTGSSTKAALHSKM
ncbi:glutathione S-transferase THETA 1 [Actinidia rufa]|uniref:Glutathione S-transferase THETA 1 n=1 Tax=Actinidia rufa TaxID=165716 RepID=A0A7J0FRS2_9ERIC|nr:glutathione S-transferase THETA 1 [Actinidia rufa]